MNVAPQSARQLVRARFFDFAGADFAISAADAVDNSHHQHRNVQYSGVVLLAPNVSFWLGTEVKGSRIYVRSSPRRRPSGGVAQGNPQRKFGSKQSECISDLAAAVIHCLNGRTTDTGLKARHHPCARLLWATRGQHQAGIVGAAELQESCD